MGYHTQLGRQAAGEQAVGVLFALASFTCAALHETLS
jgi:hypothetical protein